MSISRVGAIVLGGHVQGYGIVRLLGEKRIESVIIDTSKINIARHSKYCRCHYVSSYDGLINLLLDLGNRYKNWIVIPTDDYYVRLLSKNYDVLSDDYHLLSDSWDVIDLFFDKCKTYPWVQKLGIPTPLTFYARDVNEIEQISTKLHFPCIIKPAIMKDFYARFGSKVIVCKSQSELIRKFNQVTASIKPSEIMIQEIVSGNSENQYSVGVFCIKGRIHNSIIARRKRQHPPDFGNATTYAETADVPILLEYSKTILQNCEYSGVCEVEFKYDSISQEYKFLEVNPRFWKWHLLAKPAGVPFVYSVYNYLTAGEPISSGLFHQCAWRDIVTDLPTKLTMIRKRIYVKSDKLNTISAVANCKDIMPFFMQVIYTPYMLYARR